MNILALDLATTTGWAALKGERVESGVWKNPTRHCDGPGEFFHAFNAWLLDMKRWHAPAMVAFEMTHPHSGKAQMVSYGLISRVQEWAYDHDLPLLSVYPNTLKKFMTGDGHAFKETMIEAIAKRWGMQVSDDNQADALGVLAWALKQRTNEE